MKPETVLELPPGGDNTRNSEGAFLERDDGRLLFVYSHFQRTAETDRGGADNAPAFLAGRVSADHGRTWSGHDEVIVPNEGTENVMSVSLLRNAAGTPLLFYLVKNSWHDCRPVVRFSPDGGRNWPEKVALEEKPGYYVVNNDRAIRLSSGRLLVPAAFHPPPDPGVNRRLGGGRVVVFFSDDQGRHWRRSARALESPVPWGTPLARAGVLAGTWYASPEPLDATGLLASVPGGGDGSGAVRHPEPVPEHRSGLQEPGVIEKADGSVYLWARTDLGTQYVSRSTDGGETWSAAVAGPLVSPCSPASIRRLPGNGPWLAVYNDHSGRFPFVPGRRTPLVAAVSDDEGETWRNHKVLADDPDGWYCYTAIHFHGDQVLLSFCAGSRSRGQGLALTRIIRFSSRWLLA